MRNGGEMTQPQKMGRLTDAKAVKLYGSCDFSSQSHWDFDIRYSC